MFRKHPEKVTFHDVAAYFFEDEWKLLHEWQKELYKNVMKEIHQVLISLGYHIVNHDTLLEIYKSEEEYIQGPNDLQKRADITDSTTSSHPDVNPDLLLRITHKEDVCCRDLHSAEEAEISNNPSTACHPDINPDLLLRITHKEDLCDKETNSVEETEISNSPSTGNGHMHIRKSNKECMETLDTGLTLPKKVKEKVLQHSWKRPTYKRLNKSQGKMRKTAAKRQTKPIGASKSGKSVEKQGAQTTATLRHTCTECGKTFTRKSSLNRHLRTHTGDKPYAVSERQESCIETPKLTVHLRTQTEECAQKPNPTLETLTPKEKTCTCTECGKVYNTNSGLYKHRKTHTGENSFNKNSSHRKTHTGDNSFNKKSRLLSHQKTHTGDDSFNKKSRLISHQKTHTGDRLYTCSQCGKGFNFTSNLLRHQKIHTVKPYTCNECGRCFKISSSLVSHQRVHTEVKPHTCNECGTCFKDPSTLSKHRQIHIRVMEPEAS